MSTPYAHTIDRPVDIYCPRMATVVRSEPMTIHERFFSFRLNDGRPLGHRPGQFAEVSIPGVGEAPISVSSSPTQGDEFEMVVRNVGNVSSAMHQLRPGRQVGIRGPFGTHFPVDTAFKGRDLLFVCGGIGIVPVRSAINYVLHNRADYGKITILFGTRHPSDRLFVDEARQWAAGRDVTYIETVDRAEGGWTGRTGVITTLMPGLELDPGKTSVIVCGPPIMYKFVILELWNMKIPADAVYLSLERHMKCGVGKCGHCQINRMYACQDGPVFRYSDIKPVKEAI